MRQKILLLILSFCCSSVISNGWAQITLPSPSPLDIWLKSAEAEDLNRDGRLDQEDFEIYKEIAAEELGGGIPGGQGSGGPVGVLPQDQWLRGPEARDLNGDGRIDGQDYDLFVRQSGSFPGAGGQIPGDNIPNFPSPDEWLKSAEAEDLNRDGRIDGEDFEIFVEILAEGQDSGIPGGQNPGGPVGVLPQDQWLRGPEARDLNGDGRLDGQDYDLFVRQSGSFPGAGGQIPGGNIPNFPSPDEWLKSLEAEDLNRDGRIDQNDFDIFVEILAEEQGGGIPGGQPQGPPLGQPGGELLAAFNDWVRGPQAGDLNGDFRIDRQDYERFVADPQAALPPGFEIPLGGERFEGNLDGVDFEKELVIISRRELHPAAAVILQDREGRILDPYQLRDLVGSHPRVEVTLNGDEEIVRMVILDRIEFRGIQPPAGGQGGQSQPGPQIGQEFFGAVGRIDEGKIILSGPRFRVTANTRAADEENKPIELRNLPVGQLVTVTPGPPDPASGSPDPTVTRIQLVDPRRPPQTRYDLISGNVIALAGGVLELAGPIAALGPNTRFVSAETNQPLRSSDIKAGDFVRISTSQPGFGDSYPVATEVVLLPASVGGGAPPFQQPGKEPSGGNAPQEEIRVEGYIANVDEEGRYLSLEGERLELDTRALVFGLDDERVGLDYLVEGDLLEIDTRPGGKGGAVVTRIKVVDPAVQTFQRPGVRTGSFEAFDEGELVLAGPFFQVPEDANIQGQGGRTITLGELEEGDYVRLAASPPRYDRGETLPVAFKIRLSQAPQAPVAGAPGQPNLPGQEEWLRSPQASDLDRNGRVDPADYEIFLRQPGGAQPGGQQPGPFQQGGGRRVIGSFPEDGDVEIPAAGAVEVTFSQPVNDLLFQPEFQFMVFPQPLSFGQLEISADGRSISAEVDLEEDQVYQLVVISRDTGLYSIQFSTGEEISASSVAGEIRLPAEVPGNAGFEPGQSYAVLLSGVDEDLALDEESEDLQENIVAGAPLNGPRFQFENVNPGTYRLAAFITLNLGPGGLLDLQAIHPEPVVVGADQQVKVDLQVTLPEPLQVVSLTPQSGAVGVAGEVGLVIQFNKAAFLDAEEVLILPPPEEMGELEVDASGATYTLPLKLAEDTAYRVVVRDAEDGEGNQLNESATAVFTTGAAFAGARSLSGRLLLPDLPGNRRFVGPIFVGLVPYEEVQGKEFGLSSFDEQDIVASAITFTPEFTVENLPVVAGYGLIAYALVEVPRGFRPPHPRQRSLPAFDLRTERFRNPGQSFDTIELFGTAFGPDGLPERLRPGQRGVEVMLVGESRTRDELLFVTQAQGVAQKSAAQFDPVVELKSGAGPAAWPTAGAELSRSGIRVAFNKPLRAESRFVAIEAVLNGQPLRNFNLEPDHRAIVFPVALQSGQFYQFSVFKAEGVDGSRLERPLDLSFSTGAVQLSFGSIAGSVTLRTEDEQGNELSGDQADQIDEATVTLMQVSGPRTLSLVSVRAVDAEGKYLVDGVVPGAYQVFAEVHTASGQVLNPIYEGTLQVAGAPLTGIDLLAKVQVAAEEDTATGLTVKTAPPGGNEGAAISIDLNAAAGDQGLASLADLEAGQELTLDVYASDATDVSGYAIKLGYDPAVLEFVETDDDAGEGNFLRANSGTALFLSPLLGEGTVEFGGAILGAKQTTAVDGAGFLGRFSFRILEGFSGTQIAVQTVDLKSLTGQDELQPGLAAKLVPPVFLDQTKGVVSFDFDTDAGDQEEFNKGFITAGALVEMDLYLNFDKIGDGTFKDLSNYSVKVEFDPDQLTFINYAPETAQEENILIAGGGTVPQLPAITTDNAVTLGAAILGPSTSVAPDVGGLIGRLTFATAEQFSLTDLIITTYSIKKVGGAQQEVSSLIFARLSTGEIKLTGSLAGGSGSAGGATAAQLAQSDFDGDGIIAFDDFFLFADAFGKSAAIAGAAYDLDGDGSIAFDDFFVFADLFGKSVGKPAALPQRPMVSGGLQLVPRSTKEGLVLALQTQALPLRGLGAVVEYDPAAFRLLRVGSEASALSGREAPLLLQQQEQPGQVLVGLSRTGGEGAVEGLLAEFHFEPLAPEATGLFRVREAAVRDAQGLLVQPQYLGQVEARWVPQVFALQPNYPNPFNPATVIRYQLPAAAAVRLEVYDVLGQQVRTLVQGNAEAGFHRVIWDGRDEGGRAVAGGVYFYRLQAGEFTQVRKLLLLK